MLVLGENWLRTASQVCEALGQGCPERCKSAILMSLMMMKMMKTDDVDDDDDDDDQK